MTFSILGRKWKLTVYTDRTYYKKFGSDSHGITLMEDRQIFVRRSSINIETVIHEIVHAYTHELSFIELQLDDDQVEEFFCEVFAKYGEQILEDAYMLVKHYMN